MGDVVTLPVVRIERHDNAPAYKDRFRRRRELIGLAKQGAPVVEPDSLVMLRADETQMPCDCA